MPHARCDAPKTRRKTCTCPAYKWPHRPDGGNCRYPDPPAAECPTPAGTHVGPVARTSTASTVRRRLLDRYRLHPIRDRAKIRRFLPKLYVAYCRRRGWPWPYRKLGGWAPAMRVNERWETPGFTPVDVPAFWAAAARETPRRWSGGASPAVRRGWRRKPSVPQVITLIPTPSPKLSVPSREQ